MRIFMMRNMLNVILILSVTCETKSISWNYSNGMKSPKITKRLEELGLQDVFIVAPWKGEKQTTGIMKALESSQIPYELFEGVNGNLLYELSQNEHPDFSMMSNLHKNTTFTYESAKSLMGNTTRPYDECGIWQSELQVNFEIVERAKRTGQDKPVLLIQSHSHIKRHSINSIISEMNKLPEEWDIFALGSYHNKCKERSDTLICEFLCADRIRTMIVNGQKGAQKLISVYNTPTIQNVEVSISLYVPHKIRVFGYRHKEEYLTQPLITVGNVAIFCIVCFVIWILVKMWKKSHQKSTPYDLEFMTKSKGSKTF
ncbi:uncharacterized protein MONOS_3627 [Monocercomonoides exilis]|uniref:uncharacterized protein n=1 Tax=Monocercomonoides exilis TaxID=2049356 RepID=UPI0035593C5B|nr:hypothetical protein MONOS_3627 [Monocercomonoides exilis]|eukprot:MONOS_3627.1-p1 / transcript=MONOS_3627.1 / gene=MONOS_3627 / organism=Monocercomonoides_exilis_PA203 / gene_product=unspecified product / transcript_product=unspecified product / location=Mono_scaffold00086:133487-134428(+) / protein_length=314 / sequence_SO=supercontig / SO=protein_coding / is_pseudo=false